MPPAVDCEHPSDKRVEFEDRGVLVAEWCRVCWAVRLAALIRQDTEKRLLNCVILDRYEQRRAVVTVPPGDSE